MKWYSKDKCQMINLERVDAWFYTREQFMETPAHLTLFVHGARIETDGEEAVEIYALLQKEQELLHS